MQETGTFQSFVIKEVYKINHHFHCDRSTVDRFRLRWNNYKCSQRIASEDGTPKQNYLHQHFLSENHLVLLEDCEIRLIDKTDSSDPTRREFFSMRKLKTLAPLVFNVVEGV